MCVCLCMCASICVSNWVKEGREGKNRETSLCLCMQLTHSRMFSSTCVCTLMHTCMYACVLSCPSTLTCSFTCLLIHPVCLHFNILSVFALVQRVCISFPTSAHLLHFSAHVCYDGNTHTQIYKHTHLSGDRQRSTVGPAPVCTLAWRCSHKSGHQHLLLSPGL